MGKGGGDWGLVARMVTPGGLRQLGRHVGPGSIMLQQRVQMPRASLAPTQRPPHPGQLPSLTQCLPSPPSVHQVLRIATDLLSVLKYLGGLRPPGALPMPGDPLLHA